MFRPAPVRKTSVSFRRSNNNYGTHYFMTTSAISIKKREGWYKNTMVSLNTVSYGVTNAINVGAGLDVVSLISAKRGPVFTGRLQLSGSASELFHLGATVFYLRTRLPTAQIDPNRPNAQPGFAAALGMVTIGNADHQITLSGGATHDGSNFGRGPIFAVGGAVRVFPNVSIITENWIITDPDQTFSAHSVGARIIGEHLGIDIGLAYDKEFTTKVTPIGLPFIAATLNF